MKNLLIFEKSEIRIFPLLNKTRCLFTIRVVPRKFPANRFIKLSRHPRK